MPKKYFYFIIFCLFWQGCENKAQVKEQAAFEKIRLKAKEALDYCQSKGMNTQFCILVDLSIHSGKKRLFVWNFQNNSIDLGCLVSHGCGENPWGCDLSKEKPEFSNTDGSHASSLGKYKIGERGYSAWGINVKYLLRGLESTNSNALARTIVFHSWDSISDNEIYPDGTAEGWGCPAISNNSLLAIDPLLRNVDQPVLMWVYGKEN